MDFLQETFAGSQINGIQRDRTLGGTAAPLPNALLAQAMDSLAVGILICDTTSPGCPIVHASRGFTVITRYNGAAIMGQNIGFLFSTENDPVAMDAIREAALYGWAFQGEFLCARNGANAVWCELTLTPAPAVDGSPRHLIVLLTDITARKRGEEQTREAEARYRGMFENAVEGIYQSTPDGRYLAVNPALARMYGYNSPEELLSQVSDISHQVYVDPMFRERFQREVEQFGEVRGLEYEVRRRDGKVIWISESARVVRDAQGAARYYEGFIDDITPRKEAEQARARLEKQMNHAQKMEAIGTMAGGIAHDFNNILCAMLGLTELALANNQVTGLTRQNLEAVLRSAGRAKDLIKQILTFSRRGDGERAPVRLSAILKECVKLLNATLPSTIQISANVETTEDTVVVDATEMHQVMMNLGTNAAHAMHAKGGRLEYVIQGIELSRDQAAQLTPLRHGPHVCLTVRDNGHGMSREVMDNIFDPFFTTKPAGEGTGLGLALVHRIINQCAGHIEVESKEDLGTTFRIYLPRAEKAAVTSAPAKNQLLPGRHERLLVVDDEILILGMLQQHLRKMGYRVITRADSTAALDTFRADPGKYDLVITDHTMPCMLGAELAEKLGEIRRDVPVILMTGLNRTPSFAGSHYASRRAVITKPLDFLDLSHHLRRFLDKPGSAGGEGG